MEQDLKSRVLTFLRLHEGGASVERVGYGLEITIDAASDVLRALVESGAVREDRESRAYPVYAPTSDAGHVAPEDALTAYIDRAARQLPRGIVFALPATVTAITAKLEGMCAGYNYVNKLVSQVQKTAASLPDLEPLLSPLHGLETAAMGRLRAAVQDAENHSNVAKRAGEHVEAKWWNAYTAPMSWVLKEMEDVKRSEDSSVYDVRARWRAWDLMFFYEARATRGAVDLVKEALSEPAEEQPVPDANSGRPDLRALAECRRNAPKRNAAIDYVLTVPRGQIFTKRQVSSAAHSSLQLAETVVQTLEAAGVVEYRDGYYRSKGASDVPVDLRRAPTAGEVRAAFDKMGVKVGDVFTARQLAKTMGRGVNDAGAASYGFCHCFGDAGQRRRIA